jgi:hypothetical protein
MYSFITLMMCIMLKKSLILALSVIFCQLSQAQETGFKKPFKKFYVDAGFFLFPLEEAHFITGWDIYTDVSPKWAIGLNGFVPIKFRFPILTYSQPYLIAGIFARYKLKPDAFFFTDMGVGYGNLCYCDKFNYSGYHRFDDYTYYLQAGLGTRYLELNPYLRFKPSVKLFHLLKPAVNKKLILMPYVAMAIPIFKKQPTIIMNPRF